MPYFSGKNNVVAKVPLIVTALCVLLMHGATAVCYAGSKDVLGTLPAPENRTVSPLSPRVPTASDTNRLSSPSAPRGKFDASPQTLIEEDKSSPNRATQTIVLPGPSVGKSLLMIPKEPNPTTIEKYTTVAAPLGVKFLQVSKGTGVCLKASYAVVDKPQLLLECPKDDMIELDFEGMEIDDQALKYVSNFKNLRKIDLHRTDVTDAGLANIEDLKKIEAVDLCAGNINGSGLHSLAKMPSLTQLNLSKNSIKDITALPLLTNLKGLDMRKCNLNGSSLHGLAQINGLMGLSLAENRISAQDLLALRNLKNLERLRVYATLVRPKDAEVFREFKTLKFLEVGGSGFDDEVLIYWKRTLPNVQITLNATQQPTFPIEVFRPLH